MSKSPGVLKSEDEELPEFCDEYSPNYVADRDFSPIDSKNIYKWTRAAYTPPSPGKIYEYECCSTSCSESDDSGSEDALTNHGRENPLFYYAQDSGNQAKFEDQSSDLFPPVIIGSSPPASSENG